MIDLHVHSAFSDGCLSPEELVAAASAAGLTALALTDHDTVAGVGDFLAACRAAGLTGIAGVEISAQAEPGTLHILGLGVDPGSEPLRDALERIRRSRDERNRRILERLQDLGFALTWEEVESIAGGDVIGRPHFARAMIARGWAESVPEVFERFLEKGAPAYVDRFKLSPDEAVRLIREAGGVAAVAHPLSWIDDFHELEGRLRELAAAGLNALECHHPMFGASASAALLALAGRLGLLPTGGSDFHSADAEGRAGVPGGLGVPSVPDALLPPLLARMSPYGVVTGKEA